MSNQVIQVSAATIEQMKQHYASMLIPKVPQGASFPLKLLHVTSQPISLERYCSKEHGPKQKQLVGKKALDLLPL